MWMGSVLSTIPPWVPAIGLPRACFFTTLMPSTRTRSVPTRASTVPRRRRSRPARTMTSSPLRMFCMIGSLQDFGRQGHDLHELLGAQFARDRSEDARADGLELGVEQYSRVTAKADQRAILAAHALGGTHHHGVVDFAFFDAPARGRFFDGHLDDVANRGITALRAAQHLDAHDGTCTGVVGHVQRGLHLDHDFSCSNLTAKSGICPEPRSQFWSR